MRLGTRASALALAQAQLVAELIGGCEVVPIVTSGDRSDPSRDKSRWVRELEDALLAGTIDVAVHSAKDVPGELAEGLSLAAAPARASVEDVLCGASALDALPAHAQVGTSSLRRSAQLRAAREDLQVVPLHGNVDTRLHKLERRELDAIVLARAGLERLGRELAVGAVLDPARFVPAPGQGTLALEARADDKRMRDALRKISDPGTFVALLAERAVARTLGADCDTPLGAHAARCDHAAGGRGLGYGEPGDGEPGDGELRLRAWVGLPDGSAWASDELVGDASDPEALGRAVGERLELAGAGEILRGAHAIAARQGAAGV